MTPSPCLYACLRTVSAFSTIVQTDCIQQTAKCTAASDANSVKVYIQIPAPDGQMTHSSLERLRSFW